MTHLGITGHQSIPKAARGYVSDALRREIRFALRRGPLWGVTSLAAGADQIFAELVLRAGGRLHAIVPSHQYETTFDRRSLECYQVLLSAATEVERLEFDEATEEAFFTAGRRVVDLCDQLLAVWDGQPSRGLGGTADVVKYAKSSGRRIEIIWPTGVSR